MKAKLPIVAVAILFLDMIAPALGGTTPNTPGQPNQSCGSTMAPNTPGNAAMASGSAFNPNGKAGTVYAGQQPQNSGNPTAASQYDVACFQQPATIFNINK